MENESKFDQATRSAKNHPWLSIGTIAAVFAILQVVGPWAVGWIHQYQTVESAKAQEALIRADAKSATDKLRGEMESMRSYDNRKFAWYAYGQAKTDNLILRNRLNDCNAKVWAGDLKKAERPSCAQYDQEFEESKKRLDRLWEEAMRFGKDQ